MSVTDRVGARVSPVRCELGLYIPEDGTVHSHRREFHYTISIQYYPLPLTNWTRPRLGGGGSGGDGGGGDTGLGMPMSLPIHCTFIIQFPAMRFPNLH
jgi:hypothetical protein